MKALIACFVAIVIIVSAGAVYFEGSLPVNKEATSDVIFIVKPGSTLNSVIRQLANEGLIRNRVVFFLIAKQQAIESKIQAGDFRLSPRMSANEIATALTHGTLDKWVRISEGMRKEEVAQIMAKEFSFPESEFSSIATEGYLFPDTYLIPQGASASAIVNILETTFENKVTDEMKAKYEEKGLTLAEAVTLASLVERESRLADRTQIASILFKRLKEGWNLQVDATVQYAIGFDAGEKTWWKKGLTTDDLKTQSLYNTYEVTGLPPSPICSPSLSSLQAVADADINTPYYFYIHEPNGTVHFAVDNEEHNANVEKYLR